jgi:hypothetical protein
MFTLVFVPHAQLRSCRVHACQKRPSGGGNGRDAAKGYAHGTPEGQDLAASISVCWLGHFANILASALALWRLPAHARGRALGLMPRTIAWGSLEHAVIDAAGDYGLAQGAVAEFNSGHTAGRQRARGAQSGTRPTLERRTSEPFGVTALSCRFARSTSP